MNTTYRLGQGIKGLVNRYSLTKQLQDTVWLAACNADKTVIIKSVRHFRIENEPDVLQRFQSKSAHIRPLLDEIVDPADPPAIVLKHLDDDLLHASAKQKLSKREVKYVSRRLLQALNVLHQERFVHTDVKLNNVLVNYKDSRQSRENAHTVRFSDVQLADFGSAVSADSGYARDGDMIGAPIWRSPEASLSIPWSCSTDIWSFGTVVISLLFGGNFHLFKPRLPAGHEDYELKALEQMHVYFGPFPQSYKDIANDTTLFAITELMKGVPAQNLKPFHLLQDPDLTDADKAFVVRIMKMDPKDRPTAADLLADEWFLDDFN